MIRLLAYVLIAESLFGALYVANLLSQIGIYDPLAIALILARGALGALQFISGWMLTNRRPSGRALAKALCRHVGQGDRPQSILEAGPGTGAVTGHCGYYTEDSESLRNIARSAGVSHSAPLRHFSSLADLLAAGACQEIIVPKWNDAWRRRGAFDGEFVA